MNNLHGMENVVTREDMPRNAIALVKPGGEIVAVWRFDNPPREDCPFPGCQLSAGHPPTHCCLRPDLNDNVPELAGKYLMVADDGTVLRGI